jgi:hypothetical protein
VSSITDDRVISMGLTGVLCLAMVILLGRITPDMSDGATSSKATPTTAGVSDAEQ